MTSIRSRLLWPLLATIVVGGGIHTYTLYTSLRGLLEESLQQRAQVLADAISYAAEFAEPHALNRIVSRLGDERDVVFIMVVADQPPRVIGCTEDQWIGRPVSELPTDLTGEVLADTQGSPPRYAFDRAASLLRLSKPLLLAGDEPGDSPVGGRLVVHIGTQGLERQVWNDLTSRTAYVLITVVAVVGVAFWLTEGLVLQPIRQITDAMQRRAEGDLSARPVVKRNDEIGAVAASLNNLLDTLAQREVRIRAIVNTAADGIVTIDEHGVVELFNPAAERIFGYSAQEVIGQNVKMLMPQPYRSEHDGYIQSYLRTGQAKIIGTGREVVGQRKDGSTFPLNLAVGEVRDGQRVFTAIVRDVTDHHKAKQDLLDYQQQLRLLTAELTRAEEDERRRIATELHDQISQSLAAAKIKLGSLRQAAGALGSAPIVDEVRGMLEKAIQATRTLTFDLVSPVLKDLGLVAAVEALAQNLQKQHGLRCRVVDDGQPKPLDETTSSALYKAVREVLMNVVKHAKACQARLSISRRQDRIEVCVEDDGVGFEVPKEGFRVTMKGGYGLFHINERLTYLGGGMTVASAPGKGTCVTLSAPIQETAHQVSGAV